MVVTASIVLFKTNQYQIARLLRCLQESQILSRVLVVDNSPEPIDFNFLQFPIVQYIKSANLGYGAGHNIALKSIIDTSDYHFILNPDVYFDSSVLRLLINRISKDEAIGLLMPKVLYPNGNVQFLCKKLPTPVDLFLRRFPLPLLTDFVKKNSFNYELRFTNYDREMNIPNLSGCFMLLRVSVLGQVGLFDTRYFMYAEDIDLSRRIHAQYKTLYFPEVVVFHEYAKSSYVNIKMLFIHISSVIKYFNKWGWFFDKERKLINQQLMKSIFKSCK